jgi:ACS family hexuronate transporter-like MFS transporter
VKDALMNAPSPLPLAYESPSAVEAPSFRWVVCGLLFLATTINYMDRQILGLLAPLLQKVIGWNEQQYGNIVVFFQAAYAIGQIAFGWMIDRWGTKRGYALSIVVWSLAAAAHAAARTVLGFSAARFALGLGEAGNFPAAIKTVAEWFPKRERALATGAFNSGSTVGAIVAPLIVPPIALAFGWQAAFIALGAAGFLWLALWLVVYETPQRCRWISDSQRAMLGRADEGESPPSPAVETVVPEPPPVRWGELLRFRQTWAYSLQSLCVQPIWWFYLFWLPKFFVARHGADLQKSGRLLAVTYAMSMAGSVGGGLLSAFLLKRGWSVNAGRKTALLVCALLTVPMTAVVTINHLWLATLVIGVALAGMQGWSANAYTIVSDLFPKRAVASVVGLGSACGSACAMLLALFVGAVLERTGSYRVPFLIAGLSLPLAISAVHVLVPRWDPIRLDSGDGARGG